MNEKEFRARKKMIVNDLLELHNKYSMQAGIYGKKYRSFAGFNHDNWNISIKRCYWWDLITHIKAMWYNLTQRFGI